MTDAPALARAAQALVGCRFALHGRDPATGLDCIGVLAAALAAIGRPARLPNGYPLRRTDAAPFRAHALQIGFAPASGPALPGDVLLFTVGPAQFHVGVAGPDGGIVHAHAGLRRVVAGSVPDHWPLAGHWRLAPRA